MGGLAGRMLDRAASRQLVDEVL